MTIKNRYYHEGNNWAVRKRQNYGIHFGQGGYDI